MPYISLFYKNSVKWIFIIFYIYEIKLLHLKKISYYIISNVGIGFKHYSSIRYI